MAGCTGEGAAYSPSLTDTEGLNMLELGSVLFTSGELINLISSWGARNRKTWKILEGKMNHAIFYGLIVRMIADSVRRYLVGPWLCNTHEASEQEFLMAILHMLTL